MGELLEALDARGVGRDLVVIVTSDHGEEFQDHGGWFHGLNLHRASVSIPLIVHDARRKMPGVRRDEPVDLLDVSATVLDLAGLSPGPNVHGRALLSRAVVPPRPLIGALDPDPDFEEAVGPRQHRRAIVYGEWKIVIDAGGRSRAFDLASDPGERTPLPVARAEVPSPVRRLARRLSREINREKAPAEMRTLDAEARRRLRALGDAK